MARIATPLQISGAERRPVVAELAEAIATVDNGATVGLGGSVTTGHPMALVRELGRRGVKNLTIVAPTAGIEVDLLIACGCVSKVVSSYVGIEGVAAVGPVYRAAVQSGQVEVVDLDEAHCVVGLRAAGHRLPSMPWRGGVGTSFPQLNPTLREYDDPITGEPMLAVPAIRLDVALLYAETADEYGNAQFAGTGFFDALMGAAADRSILQVERIVSSDVIRRQPQRTSFWTNTTVVRAPFGTHPYANGSMTADEEHLRDFARGARDAEALDAYLETYVRGAPSHDDYLEAVGVRRLVALLV
jgi:glutaconate CoA-transferase subunit A